MSISENLIKPIIEIICRSNPKAWHYEAKL